MVALADAGIHVLWTNPRGSTGYGEKFAGTIDGAWGDADGDDLLNGRPDRRVDRIERIVGWFTRHLGARPSR